MLFSTQKVATVVTILYSYGYWGDLHVSCGSVVRCQIGAYIRVDDYLHKTKVVSWVAMAMKIQLSLNDCNCHCFNKNGRKTMSGYKGTPMIVLSCVLQVSL